MRLRLRASLLACFCILSTTRLAVANVEKTIFLGPNPSPVTPTNAPPLAVLSPLDPILPTSLPVAFPSSSLPHGLESWYLLRDLHAGTRYEVRVCWPATHPTDFWLDTYPPHHVYETPALAASLARYRQQVQHHEQSPLEDTTQDASTDPQSLLFLRVQAAASYYSTNRTLMDFPPPVNLDLILDPYLLNVLPRSLGPFAIYITAVAIGSWFLSGYIYRRLVAFVLEPEKPHTD